MDTLTNDILRIKKIEGNHFEYLIPKYPEISRRVIGKLSTLVNGSKPNKVIAVSRAGWIYGPLVAFELGVPFVPVFSDNKINDEKIAIKRNFVNYSGKKITIEILKSSINKFDRVLIVDDWFESGNTGKAMVSMVESLNGKVIGISIIVNEMKSKENEFFKKYNLNSLLELGPNN